MSYNISWCEDKRVFCVRLTGELTDEDWAKVVVIDTRHLEEGIAPVHIIIDVSELDSFPTNVRQTASYASHLRDPRLGWAVVVGGNPLLDFVASLLSQITGFKLTKSGTPEAALEFLRTQDATLM